jgi:hypothetical protein
MVLSALLAFSALWKSFTERALDESYKSIEKLAFYAFVLEQLAVVYDRYNKCLMSVAPFCLQSVSSFQVILIFHQLLNNSINPTITL